MLTPEAENWFYSNRGHFGMVWHTENDEGVVNGWFSEPYN